MEPVFDSQSLQYYQLVLIAAESLFFLSLLFCGLRLIYSGTLGLTERMQAKQGLQQACVNIVLVGALFYVYPLGLQLAQGISTFLGPAPSDFAYTATSVFAGSFPPLIILTIAVLLFAILAFMRFVIAFVGLFILPLAIALESLPLTGEIGTSLKMLVVANAVVQVLQAVILSILVLIVTDAGIINPNSAFSPVFSAFLAIGVLFVGVIATLGVYGSAGALGGSLQRITTNPAVGKGW
jgi:hypothetical protein